MKKNPLILIVEDSPTQAQKLTSKLVTQSYRVIVAHDGYEALQMVSQHNPDAVVLDVNLPGMDGFQVCRRLKRDQATEGLPVIMFTISDNSDATIRGIEAGADDYIPKDVFAVDNLLKSLQSLGVNTGGEV
jgi:DNA-binding response OmpR family regulator